MKYLIYTLLLIPLLSTPLLSHASHNDGGWNSWENNSDIEELGDDPVENIPIPVLFGITLSNLGDNFGDARGGGTRVHEGLDIMALLGTPVVSPTDAVVIRTGTSDSAGNYVYTANPGGEVFAYLHLDEIADDLDSGDVLEVGDFIGTVGYTGNAIASAPHLHFEIRVDDEATDPLPRITKEFDIEDKMKFLEKILDDMSGSDEDDLIGLILREYSEVIYEAQSAGVDIPEQIEEEQEELREGDFLEDVDEDTIDCAIDYSRLIRLWTRGEDVKQVQRCMNSLGFSTGVVDGIYGPNTYAGITAYQRAAGLRYIDGIVGPETSGALNAL